MTEQQFRELKPGDIFENTLTNGLTMEVTDQVRKWPDSLYVRDMQQDKIIIVKIADCANYSFIDTSKLPPKYYIVYPGGDEDLLRPYNESCTMVIVAHTILEAKIKFVGWFNEIVDPAGEYGLSLVHFTDETFFIEETEPII